MDPLFARSFPEIVSLFSEGFDGKDKWIAILIVERMAPRLDALFACEEFAPLHASTQQGWAPISFHRSLNRKPIPHAQTPEGYTRANHAKYVAALNACVAARVRLSWRDIESLVLAGALHDVGHLPGGHCMEHAVRAIDRTFSHEARGERITRLIDRHTPLCVETSLEDVLTVMRERGHLGALQRITDTLAYCFVDMLACGFMGHKNENSFLWTVRAFLESLQWAEPDGTLRLSTAKPLREILEWRAKLYRDNFLSLEHGRCEDALKALMTHLQRHGKTPDLNAFRGDREGREALLACVDALDAPRDAPRLRSMLDMANNVKRTIPGWHSHEFTAKSAMTAHMKAHPDVAHHSFRYLRRPPSLLVMTVNVQCGGRPRITVGPGAEADIPIEGPAAILYEWTG